MFKNYIKIAWRNLLKRKAYTLINIFGLALGAAICVLIVLFIANERSVDAWRSNADDVYRMVLERKYPTRKSSYAIIPPSYSQTLKDELPEVEETVRIFNFFDNGTYQLSHEDNTFEETDVYIADPSFFEVFEGDFLYGDRVTALNQPNAAVVSENTAIKYFGSAKNAYGKIMQPEGANTEPIEITGVCKDWPERSHFRFNLLLTTVGKQNFKDINYTGFSAYTYLKLNPGTPPERVEAAFPKIITQFAAADIEKSFAMSLDDFLASGNGYEYTLQPLKDIYLTSHLENEFRANGNATALYIFALVAIFILIIAGVNFINLSTARAAERAKEVGIRKTFGSEKKALVFQFLTESFLISLLAMFAAIALFVLLIPIFNEISGKSFTWRSLLSLRVMLLLFSFTTLTGLLAGIYPAFVLSSYKPITVLRGKFKSAAGGRVFRSGLVIFQFTISVILIICTLVVNRQMNFMTSENLGFTIDRTLIIERTDLLGNNTRAFKNEVEKLQDVQSISSTSAMPGQSNFFGVSWTTPENRNEPITGRGILADEGYGKTLGLELVKGRFFSRAYTTDSLAVVLNEKAVEELGLTDPIGHRIISPDGWLNLTEGETTNYKVIGVVKDFHYQSLHEPITPLIFVNATRFNGVMGLAAVHINGTEIDNTINSIASVWKRFVLDKPFSYQFLDATIKEQYQAEATARKVFTFFSGITIFIACIGLLGLAAYTTRQRIQEIGIRKVLGAKVTNIVALLSKDFIKLVLISTLIAIPIAWYAMYNWLQGFTYHIQTSWDLFLMAAAIALVTAFLTIAVQAIKAATANPIKSLQIE